MYSLIAWLCVVGAASSRDVRVGHWNVYWRALDDRKGQEAIRVGIDAAAKEGGDFDFFAIIEATGEFARFPDWVQGIDALKEGSGMQVVHGRSFHETLALFYRSEAWEPIWFEVNEFESGRPFITALFKIKDESDSGKQEAFFNCDRTIWVMAAHLPHYSHRFNNWQIGDHMRDALVQGQGVTGCDASITPTIIMGDFNEFGACSLPPNRTCAVPGFQGAAKNLQPLWDYLGEGTMADATEGAEPTCCTKWHEGVKDDWSHHYDHIYYTPKFLNISRPAAFIPYVYPGVDNCTGEACAGPLHGAKPFAQGTWHRGWQTTFSLDLEDELNWV